MKERQQTHTSCTYVPLILVITGASKGNGSAGPVCGLQAASDLWMQSTNELEIACRRENRERVLLQNYLGFWVLSLDLKR